MGISVTATCDLCAQLIQDPSEYCARISLRSHSYEYDGGTVPQERDWMLCRHCKVAFLGLMEDFPKITQARQDKDSIKALKALLEREPGFVPGKPKRRKKAA